MSTAALDPAQLTAWSVEVGNPGDLLTWLPAGEAFAFLRGGDGIVGWGEALRLSTVTSRAGRELASEVADLLAAMTTRDDVGVPGSGPVAIASLVFDPRATGSVIVVPRVVLGRRDGRCWLTLVTPPGEAVSIPQLRRRPVAAAAAPTATVVDEVPAAGEWEKAVATAVRRMRAGQLDKVVLARAVDVEAADAIDCRTVAVRLAERFPSCFTYVCDGLVGASPELLVRRIGRHAESVVLAGTTRRGNDSAEDETLEAALVASAKDAHEHRIAAQSAVDVFTDLASDVSVADPHVLRLANVMHLATAIEAWLPAPAPTALELATRLHPTAAVGGLPTDEALSTIRELESAPRGRYAGPVGWVDAHGDGEFAIALRCAQLDGRRARLWAGAGIVAESDPVAEVAETDVKFDAVLSALLN